MADNVVSKTYRVLRDASTKAWDRVSFWTKGSSVEFNDGLNAEQKVGAIAGITDSLNSTSSNVAASANAVNTLSSQLGGLSFAQDEYGNWGFKVGADPVTPFSNGYRKKVLLKKVDGVGTITKEEIEKVCTENGINPRSLNERHFLVEIDSLKAVAVCSNIKNDNYQNVPPQLVYENDGKISYNTGSYVVDNGGNAGVIWINGSGLHEFYVYSTSYGGWYKFDEANWDTGSKSFSYSINIIYKINAVWNLYIIQ